MVARQKTGRAPYALKQIAALLASLPGLALGAPPDPGALPSGAQIVAGQASLRSSPARLDIDQSTSRAIINWNRFDIGAQASVVFNQPGASAVALNRVLSNDPSSIYGRLSANGQIFLVNPSGVVFGPGSSVSTAGIAASTMSIGDADFLAGNYRFTRSGTTSGILNQGSIVSDGGYVALLAPEIRNEGLIRATMGSVALAAGEAVTLNLDNDNRLKVAVEPSTVRTLIENSQLIQADGGTVLMSSSAASELLGSVIRNTGVIEANSMSVVNGEVILSADKGTAVLEGAGRVSARGASSGESGGTVKLLGSRVGLLDTAAIDANGAAGGGTVLIGGNAHGAGPEPNAKVSYVASGASVKADALERGDGGKVVVWSDAATGFYGSISARGGEAGGNGGFVETSGGELAIGAAARVDTSSPAGAAGSWLLDPTNINVVSSNPGDGSYTPQLFLVDQFASTDVGTNLTSIDVASINNSTGPVTLQAKNDINFNAAVAMTSPSASLTAQAGNNINVNNPISGNSYISLSARDPGGTQSATGTVTIASGANVSTTAGIITINNNGGTNPLQLGANISTPGQVSLQGSVQLIGPVTITATNGGVQFAKLDGAYALTVNSAGITAFQNTVGGTNPLASITTDAAGTTRFPGGAVTTTGAQTYNDPVLLPVDTTLTASIVKFGSTVDNATATKVGLSIVGNAAFGDGSGSDMVGLGTNGTLASLSVSGTTALASSVSAIGTSGNQTYSGAVTLADGNAAVSYSLQSGGNTSFGSTLDGANPGKASLTLTTGGTVSFGGAVGATNSLAQLSTPSNGTTNLGGNVTTSGSQFYGNAVVLTADVTTASTSSSVGFTKTVDGAHALTMTIPAGGSLSGAVGGTTPLTSLTVNAGTGSGQQLSLGANVITTGAQTYNGAVVLALPSGNITTTSTGGGAIGFNGTLDTMGVAHPVSLTVNTSGATTFGGVVGGVSPLSGLVTDAPGTTTLSGGSIVTNGSQTYNDPVILAAATTISPVSANATFASTINGAQSLSLVTNGTVVFGGAVGNTTALTSITTDAGGTTAFNGGTVTTTGNQTYNDLAVLGAATTLSAGSGNVTFGAAVDGAQALTVNSTGATGFAGVVGGTTALSSLTTNAGGTVSARSVTTTGAQSYGENATLGGNYATSNSAFNVGGTTTLGAPTTIATGSGNVTLTGAISGAQALNVISGGTTAFGSSVTIASLSAGAPPTAANPTPVRNGTISFGGSVTTTGDFGLYTSQPVSLPGTTVGGKLGVDSTGQVSQTGPIAVTGTSFVVGGGNTILLTNTQNSFGGTVSLSDPTGSASITSAGGLTLGTSSVGGGLTAVANANGTSTGTLNLGSGTVSGALSGSAGSGNLTWGTLGSSTSPIASANLSASTVTSGSQLYASGPLDITAATLSGGPSPGSITAGSSTFSIGSLANGSNLQVSLSSLRLMASSGSFQFATGSLIPGGVTSLDPSAVSVFLGTTAITTSWDVSALQTSATTQTTATVTQTSVVQAPPGPTPTVSIDTAIVPTQSLVIDSSLSIGASIAINQPVLSTSVASVAPTTTASPSPTSTGTAATTGAAPTGGTQAGAAATTDTGSGETKSETTASTDKGASGGTRSQSTGAPRTALSAAEKLLKLAEEQAERRQARTARYKSAIEVIRKAATVADIPLCGPSTSEVCMPVKQGIVSDAAGGAPQLDIPATEVRRKIAVLFGNNEYKGDIPKLETPIDDVSAIGKVLGDKFGYEVKIVRNATKADIVREFKTLTEQTSRDESVMVMYAGHGYQLEDSKAGFWIPVDASAQDPKTWVSNNDIQRFLNRIDAKQISVVSDSCFSGTLTKEQRLDAPRNESKPELLSKRAVVTLSSGDEEPVADEGLEGHSIFAYHLLKELGGIQRASPISVTYERLRESVAQSFPQTPQLGGVASAGHMSGANYIFEVK